MNWLNTFFFLLIMGIMGFAAYHTYAVTVFITEVIFYKPF